MADDVNLYSYVGNSPVMKVDLLGLWGASMNDVNGSLNTAVDYVNREKENLKYMGARASCKVKQLIADAGDKLAEFTETYKGNNSINRIDPKALGICKVSNMKDPLHEYYGSAWYFEKNKGFGHSSLLYIDNSGSRYLMNFGPDEDYSKFEVLFFKVPGTHGGETKGMYSLFEEMAFISGELDKTINIKDLGYTFSDEYNISYIDKSMLNMNKMVNYYENYKNQDYKYRGFDNNCSDVVAEVLKEGNFLNFGKEAYNTPSNLNYAIKFTKLLK